MKFNRKHDILMFGRILWSSCLLVLTLSVNAMSTLIVVTVTLVLVLANLIPWIKDKKAQKEEPQNA